MKKIKIIPMLLVFLILTSLFTGTALAVDAPEIQSNAAILIEKDSRTVLFSQNENVRVYPASTTKIMTVMLAVEAIEDGRVALSDNVTATDSMQYDLISDGSSAGIIVGETMTLEDLLYCAMLASGNDACNVIAEYIGGSIENFVVMMNERATELGCVGTSFANTHGLPNENHYTTAMDFSLIALEAVSHSEFMTICDTIKYEVPETNTSERRYLSNSNGLINPDSALYSGYVYEYAHGVKTGYTSAAGHCLVSTAQKDGEDLVCVIMGGIADTSSSITKYSNFVDSTTLYDWGFDNFSFQEILTKTEEVVTIDIAYGSGRDSVALKPQNTITAYLPNDTAIGDFELEITTEVGEDGGAVSAPIESGDVLGEVTLTLDGVSYGTVNLVAATSVELAKTTYIQNGISDFFGQLWIKIAIIVIGLLLILYVISVIHYRQRRRKYVKYMRARRAQEKLAQEQVLQEFEESKTPPSNASQLERERQIEEMFKR